MSNKTETFDPNQIMQHIQNQIQQAAPPQRKRTLKNAKLTYPAKPTDIPYNLELYKNFETVYTLIPAYDKGLFIQNNSLTRIPVIGKIVQSIQIRLHQIAFFYTNRALKHQLMVNQQLLYTLEQLTVESQKQQRTITQLQSQIQTLQEASAA